MPAAAVHRVHGVRRAPQPNDRPVQGVRHIGRHHRPAAVEASPLEALAYALRLHGEHPNCAAAVDGISGGGRTMSAVRSRTGDVGRGRRPRTGGREYGDATLAVRDGRWDGSGDLQL